MMTAAQLYLHKSARYPQLIDRQAAPNLHTIVVIPCYKEEDILQTLEDLIGCHPTGRHHEVIVVVNDGMHASVESKKFNDQTYASIVNWTSQNTRKDITIHAIRIDDMPPKFAGVGLARKIGLDEAVRRFSSIESVDGILVCLDADSRVEPNYLIGVSKHFTNNPKHLAASIHYEHPIDGHDQPAVYKSIVQYELHLRYFIEQQRRLRLPFAYHTIGSSMAVRWDAYCSVGGMNRRKAGEDFYFIHKFIKAGDFGEITQTKVIPSPRVSNRVPFGTGKAVGDMIANAQVYMTYHPDSFHEIGRLLEIVEKTYEEDCDLDISTLTPPLQEFLLKNDLQNRWKEIRKNTSSREKFFKRFFHWFDAFLLMKCLHFMRDHGYSDIPVCEAVDNTDTCMKPLTDIDKLAAYRVKQKRGYHHD